MTLAAPAEQRTLSRFWTLDPAVNFLNHGSYGAAPRAVLDAQQRVIEEMEREPVRFMLEKMLPLLDESRAEVASFVGAAPDRLAFTPNATVSLASMLASIDFQPGDEVLINDHEYMSLANELRRLEKTRGIRVVVAPVPFPVSGPDEVADAVLSRATERTRLAVVSHITSPTALILPVERIVRELAARGIETMVDGAHAPGAIPLDIESIGCAYYAGDLHKWGCSPKGAGFLWVREDLADRCEPLALSSRADTLPEHRRKLHHLFDYVGTRDCSAWIVAGEALRHVGSLVEGGWPEIMRRNHELAIKGRNIVCELAGLEPGGPDEMHPAMAAMKLPPATRQPAKDSITGDDLWDRLLARGFQQPIWTHPLNGLRAIRISAHLYNSEEQYRMLGEALREELGR
ncbi:MAG: aminotransferase class V-fold PLP-dependent enzyme [Phycisphaerales bacterium]|nr:MAG: aminotransferase class V-fold PLP-dependent enzyme [Phycisphaerales bacterium]